MKLNPLFSENMVLQRDVPVPVWGVAEPGDEITLTFAGQTHRATTDQAGRWQLTLRPVPASHEPRDLVIRSKVTNQTSTIPGVLVGEVWLCSGQSNMQWGVGSSLDQATETRLANHPHLRQFTVPCVAAQTPQTETKGAWTVCSPATVGRFSGVGYFFARKISERLGGIPVGMINASWGGTIAEAWTSREALLAVPELRGLVEKADREFHSAAAQAEFQAKQAAWEASIPRDPGDTGWARGWAAVDAPAEGWQLFPVPGTWQSKGCDFSGVFWFRREVEIPAAWAGHDLHLNLGPCDKSDITWFNNEVIGSITLEQRGDAWSVPRQYKIPGRLVRAGRNVLAVRIFSNMYAGGFTARPADMCFIHGTDRLPLAGDWLHRVEVNFGKINTQPPSSPYGDQGQHVPAALFHAMIAPLVPYALRGAIWYQGESNVGRALQYVTLFPTLIRDWRRRWGQDFPFHFVQLANYLAEQAEPGESAWAELREAQRLALREPHTGMAVIIDRGEANDIHPQNKQDVGRRLAASVLAQVYGQDLPASGPVLRESAVTDSLVRLQFDHVNGGLVTSDGGPVRGFAIAGADRKFYWAQARIAGDTVICQHRHVPNPVAVRYAWADNPACNLANGAGLPASPFRTDDGKWTT